MTRTPLLLSALALGLAAPRPAAADVNALADEIKSVTNDDYRAWSIKKLTTWKVGKQCWEKLEARDGRPLDLISRSTRYIAEFAKHVTGDDWPTIEGSGMSEKEAAKPKLEPMIDAFKSKFSLSVSIDGDDCDDSHDPLWMQYVMRSLEALAANPPAAGKAFITIDVSSKAKKLAIAVGKDGATFKITAPKALAPAKWQDAVARAFEKVSKKKQ